MIKLFITVILATILVSCNESRKYAETYSTYTWTDDSLLIKKEYYHDSLMSVVSYQKDTVTKQDSSIYYSHGKPVKIMFYEDDKLAGSYIEYDSLGKPRKYICYDSYGVPIFQRTYDEQANIVYEKGDLIEHGVLNKHRLVDDKLVSYNSFIVKPPYSSIIVNNYFLNVSTKDTIRSFNYTELFDWEYVYFFRIHEQGKYIYYQFTTVIDSIRKKKYIIRDSIVSDFTW